MGKIVTGIAIALFAVNANAIEVQAVKDGRTVETKFGRAEVRQGELSSEDTLYFRNQKVDTDDFVNGGLSIAYVATSESSIAVLLSTFGGLACPVQYEWVVATKHVDGMFQLRVTKPFGECGELTSIEAKGNRVTVITPILHDAGKRTAGKKSFPLELP